MLVDPSPKFQLYEVALSELLVNVTAYGAQPLVPLTVAMASGVW